LIDYDRSIRLVDFGLSNTYRKGLNYYIQMKDLRQRVDRLATQLPKWLRVKIDMRL